MPMVVNASPVSDLQSQLDAHNAQADQLQAAADAKQQEAATLQGQLDAMTAQANALQDQINRTTARMQAVDAQINAVLGQMAAKKAVLAEYIRSDYFVSSQSTVEMLAGSGSLADFMDQKQYLNSSQQKINGVLAEIEAIKAVLDQKKAEIDKLGKTLAQQKASLDAEVALKDQLLQKTRGEEANYQALLSQEQAAASRLGETIARLQGGPMSSKGYVRRGQVIGLEGSTGFSTGPHVHFGIYVNQQAVNPNIYINSGRVAWPLESYVVTQGFGPASWSNSHYSFHDGIDMDGGYGSPVHAACSGNIVLNGWQPDGFGHYIVIDCGGGLWALTGHMQS